MRDDDQRTAGAARGGRLSAQGQHWLALGLLLLGGALGAVALFSPWARVTLAAPLSAAPGHMTITIYAPFLSGVRLLTRADTAGARLLRALFPPLFYFYIALGTLLALSLAIWRGRLARRALLIADALWLAALLVMLALFSAQLVSGHGADAYLQITRRMDATATIAPAVGLWLGWLAVALGGVGLLLVARAPDVALAAPRPTADGQRPRGRLELGGVAFATLGVVLWGVGYYTLPWLTQGCAGLHFSLNHYVSGSCAGLDAADVFVNSSLASLPGRLGGGPNNPLALVVYPLTDVAFHYLALGLLALWAVARLWWGAAGGRRYGWTLAWLLCAGASTGWTAQGAARARDLSPSFSFGSLTQGAWSYGPGLVVALTGLALVGLSLVGLFVARRIHHRIAEPAALVEV